MHGDRGHHQGLACTTTTSLNAIFPGAVLESKRTIWELGQIDGQRRRARTAPATPPARRPAVTVTRRTFMRQGIFVP